MAVFTEVSLAQVATLLQNMSIGQAKQLVGISAGIENTNYFLTTNQGEYVLTIFERLTASELPFYLQLMRHLAQKQIAVANPQPNLKGEILFELQQKPCCIVNKLDGKSELSPTVQHCQIIGANLAKMHLAAADFTLCQPNLRGLDWWQQTVPEVLPFLNPQQSQMLQDELAYQQQIAQSDAYKQLPKAAVHCDLFRDNVLFNNVNGQIKLGGFFDFYFAGFDSLLFDLAVCLNDWCIDHNEKIDKPQLQTTLLESYWQVRPFTTQEQQLFPAVLRAAALRFWISRLWDFYLPRQAKMLKPHDPSHFEQLLAYRRTSN